MQPISYDTETTSLKRRTGEIFSFSTCTEDEKISVHRLDGSTVRVAQSKKALADLWEDRGTRFAKVMHNAKFDLGFTEVHFQRKLRHHTFHDTMLMSHILRNDHPSHGLKELAWDLAGISKHDEQALKPYTKGGRSYQTVPENLMNKYQQNDAIRGMLLFMFFWPKIQSNKDWIEIYDNERAVIPVTLDMEDRGVMLHTEKAHKLITKLECDCDEILNQIEAEYGERIKPGTDKFLWLLFQKLKLPVYKRTPTGKPAARKEIISQLHEQYPNVRVLELALKYKSWSHGVSTLHSYLGKIDSDGVIHPNIHTCEAITARESCTDPNLQNVDKTGVLKNPYAPPLRSVFRPRPGYVNFHLDYSGQEARLLIHYSGDDVLVKIANTPGGDTHAFIADLFYQDRFRSAEGAAKKTLRNAAKNGFFCKSYGGAAPKLAVVLDISVPDAARAVTRFNQALPKLGRLMDEVIRDIKRTGRIVTAFGRYLHVPVDQAYIGVNYLIQGTAAEMLKRGQVRVHEYLQSATSGEMQLLLPIHDELIIECPRTRLKDAKEILRHVAFLMTDFPGRFKVPMEVEVDIATVDWSLKNKFSLEVS